VDEKEEQQIGEEEELQTGQWKEQRAPWRSSTDWGNDGV
jgi:hypothetical protein